MGTAVRITIESFQEMMNARVVATRRLVVMEKMVPMRVPVRAAILDPSEERVAVRRVGVWFGVSK